jgi:hypothetical protein
VIGKQTHGKESAMAQAHEPGKDQPAGERNQGAEASDTGRPEETVAPAPYKHTRWQNFIREMWLILGPAQTGLPPYATPGEREAWRLANLPIAPEAKRTSEAPPGYRITQYTDGQGYTHRSLVPITEPRTAEKPGEPPDEGHEPGDTQQD